MPWTFAHPVIVFPLKQSRYGRWLNLPALITGSVSPDLLYSSGMYRAADEAHHFTSWFYTGLPVCLAVLAALCTAPLAYRLAQTATGVHINRFVFYELSFSVSFFAGFVALAALFQVIRKR